MTANDIRITQGRSFRYFMTVEVKRCLWGVLAAAGFAFLIMSVPWVLIKGSGFADVPNYVESIGSGRAYFLAQSQDDWLSYITGEWMWHQLTGYLVWERSVSVYGVLEAVTALTLFAQALYLIVNSRWSLLWLLVNPLVIDFAFSQFRMAFAASLMLLALTTRVRTLIIVVCVIAPLIHTASLIFIAAYAVAVVSGKYIHLVRRTQPRKILLCATVLIMGGVVSLMLGPLREGLLSTIGDRRADYHDMSSSLAYVSVWIVLLITILIQRVQYLARPEVMFTGIIFSIVAFNLFTGAPSVRLISVVFPLAIVVISGIRTNIVPVGRLGNLLVVLLSGYMLLQWYYWLGYNA